MVVSGQGQPETKHAAGVDPRVRGARPAALQLARADLPPTVISAPALLAARTPEVARWVEGGIDDGI